MSKIEEVKSTVEKGKAKLIAGVVQEALDEGNEAKAILDTMIEAMSDIGERFSAGEAFVPQLLLAAKSMKNGVQLLKPLLGDNDSVSRGKFIIGTVAGDLHDIGKNLVSLMIESSGFEVIDLGVDVSTDKFIEAVKANENVKIVACSGLLTTTMPAMKETVQALKSESNGRFKVMVGGAPVTPEFAEEIGADAYTPDAGSAAQIAKEIA